VLASGGAEVRRRSVEGTGALRQDRAECDQRQEALAERQGGVLGARQPGPAAAPLEGPTYYNIETNIKHTHDIYVSKITHEHITYTIQDALCSPPSEKSQPPVLPVEASPRACSVSTSRPSAAPVTPQALVCRDRQEILRSWGISDAKEKFQHPKTGNL
jgi:hypothetical protein